MPVTEKNLCNKERTQHDPYEIWQCPALPGWEWRVMKKWQRPDLEAKNVYARWFCAVKSPHTFGGCDMGDIYVTDIKENGGIKVYDSAKDDKSRIAEVTLYKTGW